MLTSATTTAVAQIPPPGHEEYLKRIEEQKQVSVLDRDSVSVIDTTILYDPDTYEQSVLITTTVMSWRDYCQHILGLNDADRLLRGETLEIVNPDSYEKMKIRWNATESKIDTIK